MVTWPVTMKLFPAKCHEQGTLRKLWRQTGNSSLLPAKCWPLLRVIRECIWRWPDVVAGISARYSKFAFVLFCYITFLSRETLKFSGNKIHCSPRDQSLSVYCYIPRLSISKTGVVIGWFLVTCPWSNLNVKGTSFYRNCGAASVGEWYTKIRFIKGVDNVNWPAYRDWKADVSSVSPSSERI